MKDKKFRDCFILLRRTGGRCLRKIQRAPLYKKIMHWLCYGIEIKEADEADIKRIYAWFQVKVDVPAVTDTFVTHFVARKAKKIIGFVLLLNYPEGKTLFKGYWLFCLTVRPLYRGLGIGEELSKSVIVKAREKGVQELSLLVFEDNDSAISLYNKLGFQKRMIPALEELLEKEKNTYCRRRIVMVKMLV